mmetsp:Transcript_113016/g.326585  ORF Transcript_113016/g.326585 Transcript_113016/m.326585 type:complete len:206 (+) Transcript_113016:4945-5562(+)
MGVCSSMAPICRRSLYSRPSKLPCFLQRAPVSGLMAIDPTRRRSMRMLSSMSTGAPYFLKPACVAAYTYCWGSIFAGSRRTSTALRSLASGTSSILPARSVAKRSGKSLMSRSTRTHLAFLNSGSSVTSVAANLLSASAVELLWTNAPASFACGDAAPSPLTATLRGSSAGRTPGVCALMRAPMAVRSIAASATATASKGRRRGS